ncbi:MAG: ribonuclease catalytic domain-containing protein, partial [Acidobacteriota bacterium]|nr:ribonuclease catalytic domain-containing protein [Acidobacteriota bacterium]
MKQLSIVELGDIAQKAMRDAGFIIKNPPPVEAEVREIEARKDSFDERGIRDLQTLLWSSIDNETSRDLDQIEYAERLANGDIKLLVGIADVDEFVPKNSAIDDLAAKNTATVYTEGDVFPMLPLALSTDATSLLPNVERLAVVVEMIVCENGDVEKTDFYRALTRNCAKLSYEQTGAWLDENAAAPAIFEAVKGLREQILLQKEAALRLHKFRQKKGALEFETVESSAVKTADKIVDLESVLPNTAQLIIENFMIAANVETAEFLESKNVASIRRVVKTPARWNGIREIARKYGTDLPEMPDSPALSTFLETRRKADALHFPDLSLSIIKLLGAGEYVVQ